MGAPNYGVLDGENMLQMIGFFVMMTAAVLVEVNPLLTIIGMAIALALIIIGDIYFPENEEIKDDDIL